MKNKKPLLVLSALLLAGAIKPFSAHAPALNEPMRKVYRGEEKRHLKYIDIPESVAESIVLPEPRGLIEKLHDIESQVFENDKIYQYIDSLYNSMGIRHPYITREFIRAVIYAESFNSLTGRENPRAISKAGARGLTQVMEDSWYMVEKANYYANAFNPKKNIEVGIKIFLNVEEECNVSYPNWKNLSKEEKSRILLVGYNWGLGNFRANKWNLNKLPEETEEYIKKVQAKAEEYQERKKAVYTKNRGLVLKLY